MISSHGRIVALSLALLTVFGAATALPALALEADSGSTYVNPSAPGATGEFRATVVAERGDNATRNGLKRMTLDFSADSDYSGSVAGVTPRDVDLRVTAPSGNGSVPAGPVRVSSNPAGDRLTITLLSVYGNVQPGDEISARVDGVRNTEIAIPDPQGARGFALGASVSDPQGNTDGPVELRYSIDPNATAQNATNMTDTNASNMTDANATNATNATNTTDSNMTGAGNATTPNMTGSNMTGPNASNMTASNTTSPNTTNMSDSNVTDTGNATADTTSTVDTTTAETTTTTTTATATSTAAETTGGGGATETTTTGPGFGLLAAVIALLAVALLATRRRG